MTWNLSEDGENLEEIFDAALSDGPQRIQLGDQIMYVLSDSDFGELTTPASRPSFKEFLRGGPDISDLDLDRDKGPSREVDL
jgi:hypothetical protein